jgi:hypothetical protein
VAFVRLLANVAFKPARGARPAPSAKPRRSCTNTRRDRVRHHLPPAAPGIVLPRRPPALAPSRREKTSAGRVMMTRPPRTSTSASTRSPACCWRTSKRRGGAGRAVSRRVAGLGDYQATIAEVESLTLRTPRP